MLYLKGKNLFWTGFTNLSHWSLPSAIKRFIYGLLPLDMKRLSDQAENTGIEWQSSEVYDYHKLGLHFTCWHICWAGHKSKGAHCCEKLEKPADTIHAEEKLAYILKTGTKEIELLPIEIHHILSSSFNLKGKKKKIDRKQARFFSSFLKSAPLEVELLLFSK